MCSSDLDGAGTQFGQQIDQLGVEPPGPRPIECLEAGVGNVDVYDTGVRMEASASLETRIKRLKFETFGQRRLISQQHGDGNCQANQSCPNAMS